MYNKGPINRSDPFLWRWADGSLCLVGCIVIHNMLISMSLNENMV